MAVLDLNACTVDFDRALILRDGEALSLTPNEAALLRYLAARPGQLVDRSEVDRVVFGIAPAVESRAAVIAVRRLRAKIERDPSRPEHLHTLRGRGFRLDLREAAPPVEVPTGLVGRERLWRVLQAAWGRPWITLVGPPGVGKSALARALLDGVADGRPSTWADLQPARDDDDVLLAVGDALGAPRATPEELGWVLRGRRLVLDGAEGCLEVLPALVAAWAERTAIVVTSQAPVGHPDEHVIEVCPLDTDAALELLEARARAAWPGWRSEPETRATLTTLAERLDGLPLALEIAGGRLAVLGPDALLVRLTHRGHAGLEDVLGRAWDVLDDAERQVLFAAATFAGRFRADEVEAVLGAEALDVLTDLVTRGLVAREPAGLRLLATVRDFVRARSGPEWADRHADHVLAEVEPAWLERWRVPEDLGRLARALPDLRRAAALASDPDLRVRATRIAGSVLQIRAALSAWRELLEATADAAGWTRGLRLDRACLEYHATDKQAAVPALQALVEEGRADDIEADALRMLAQAARNRGDQPEAERLTAACLARCEALDLPRLALTVRLGVPTAAGDPDVRDELRSVLEAFEALGDDDWSAVALNDLACAEQAEGHTARALQAYRRVLAHAEATGHQRLRAVSLDNVAAVLIERGELDEAEAVLDASAELARGLGLRWLAAVSWGRRGTLRLLQGEPAAAEEALRRAVAELTAAGVAAEVEGYRFLWAIACLLMDDPDGARARLDPPETPDAWNGAIHATLLATAGRGSDATALLDAMPSDPAAGRFVSAARACVALASGDPEPALALQASVSGGHTLDQGLVRRILEHLLVRPPPR